jgi:hypothetical protein
MQTLGAGYTPIKGLSRKIAGKSKSKDPQTGSTHHVGLMARKGILGKSLETAGH